MVIYVIRTMFAVLYKQITFDSSSNGSYWCKSRNHLHLHLHCAASSGSDEYIFNLWGICNIIQCWSFTFAHDCHKMWAFCSKKISSAALSWSKSWAGGCEKRIRERFFSVTNVPGRKFNARIKVPLLSLKGKSRWEQRKVKRGSGTWCRVAKRRE